MVVTGGTAVLGLENIGLAAEMPVMEGKAALFEQLVDIDTWPICLNAHSADDVVSAVRAITPGFSEINLEDIRAPRCFAAEDRLQDLGIPVMHDDQHGTAIVLRAGLINAARAIAHTIPSPDSDHILPAALDRSVPRLVSNAVMETAAQRR